MGLCLPHMELSHTQKGWPEGMDSALTLSGLDWVLHGAWAQGLAAQCFSQKAQH